VQTLAQASTHTQLVTISFLKVKSTVVPASHCSEPFEGRAKAAKQTMETQKLLVTSLLGAIFHLSLGSGSKKSSFQDRRNILQVTFRNNEKICLFVDFTSVFLASSRLLLRSQESSRDLNAHKESERVERVLRGNAHCRDKQ
jgi:hypothetical protein